MIEEKLIQLGQEYFDKNNGYAEFTKDKDLDDRLNDLVNYPHIYVLGCCMDRQIKSEKAWLIPIQVANILGNASMSTLSKVTLDKYIKIFNDNKLHRFNKNMATIFYNAVQLIHTKYNDDASNIWKNNLSSAAIVYRFLEFDGVGVKIATMATNILARQFKIPMADYYCIDVSPDTHVRRTMKRLGLVEDEANINQVIYKAREINPSFPGIIDVPLFELGRNYCHPSNPNCKNCMFSNECKYFNTK